MKLVEAQTDHIKNKLRVLRNTPKITVLQCRQCGGIMVESESGIFCNSRYAGKYCGNILKGKRG